MKRWCAPSIGLNGACLLSPGPFSATAGAQEPMGPLLSRHFVETLSSSVAGPRRQPAGRAGEPGEQRLRGEERLLEGRPDLQTPV